MFGKKFRRKYALTDKGAKSAKRGALWTVAVNLAVMCGIWILYSLMEAFMAALLEGAALPSLAPFIAAAAAFLVVSLFLLFKQYNATYTAVYDEVEATRLGLAERLRKLPLGYFGRRDLADLAETLMGDVQRMERVWSHVLPYLYGSFASTALAAVFLFMRDWREQASSSPGKSPPDGSKIGGCRFANVRFSSRKLAPVVLKADGKFDRNKLLHRS